MDFQPLKFVQCLICFLLWSTVMTGALRIGPVSTKILDHGTAGMVMVRRNSATGMRSGLGSFQSTLSSSRLLSSTSSTNNAPGRYDELAYKLQSYLGGIYAVSPSISHYSFANFSPNNASLYISFSLVLFTCTI